MEKVSDHVENVLARIDEYEAAGIVPPDMLKRLAANAVNRSALYKFLKSATGATSHLYLEVSAAARAEQWQAVADAREHQEHRARGGYLVQDRDRDFIEILRTRSASGMLIGSAPRATGWLWGGLIAGAVVLTLWVLYWLSCGATLARECRS